MTNINDEAIKNHLHDLKISLARTLIAAARAEIAPRQHIRKILKKSHFVWYMFWTAAHAEVQAHTFDDRKQKLTIFQMLFDYLVASLAQKLEKMEEIEIGCKIEKI